MSHRTWSACASMIPLTLRKWLCWLSGTVLVLLQAVNPTHWFKRGKLGSEPGEHSQWLLCPVLRHKTWVKASVECYRGNPTSIPKVTHAHIHMCMALRRVRCLHLLSCFPAWDFSALRGWMEFPSGGCSGGIFIHGIQLSVHHEQLPIYLWDTSALLIMNQRQTDPRHSWLSLWTNWVWTQGKCANGLQRMLQTGCHGKCQWIPVGGTKITGIGRLRVRNLIGQG